MTRHELARKLGIQPCHVDANELVDLADAKDRDGYRDKLDQIERDRGKDYRYMVSEHAARQIRMQSRYHRHNGWRSVWQEHKREGRA